MKLKFVKQQFQLDAVEAVAGCFENSRHDRSPMPFTYEFQHARAVGQAPMGKDMDAEQLDAFGNRAPRLSESELLDRVRSRQQANGLPASLSLERPRGFKNRDTTFLTVEMETGTGKTYTYIRTMLELHRRYGWLKFMVVVPSVAIREGVRGSFEAMADHFFEEYGHHPHVEIYDSSNPAQVKDFCTTPDLSVLVVNTQAFNARGENARRMHMPQDSMNTEKPVEWLARTRPILVVDEPQSVEGEKTMEALAEFDPLLVLRYSATPRQNYNLVYRLDPVSAYSMRLVKKIGVKGFELSGYAAGTGYLRVVGIETAVGEDPVVVLEFEKRQAKKVERVAQKIARGENLHVLSGEIPAYQGMMVGEIDAVAGTVEVGMELFEVGTVVNDLTERVLRRNQIRETIASHLQKERELHARGIKVLSLFFIDEVAKYRAFDDDGHEKPGLYAEIFEQEYERARALALAPRLFASDQDSAYREYLLRDGAGEVHKGYFSIDKKGRFTESKLKRGQDAADDPSAYELIMKDKERLLSLEEPTRFIFSHSALREGWDNPNVFQIGLLKNPDLGSEIRRRQEVGRGLRLSVDKFGQRQDQQFLGDESEVHKLNLLTIVCSETYQDFVNGFQKELSADIPRESLMLKPEDTSGLSVRVPVRVTAAELLATDTTLALETPSSELAPEQRELVARKLEEQGLAPEQLEELMGEMASATPDRSVREVLEQTTVEMVEQRPYSLEESQVLQSMLVAEDYIDAQGYIGAQGIEFMEADGKSKEEAVELLASKFGLGDGMQKVAERVYDQLKRSHAGKLLMPQDEAKKQDRPADPDKLQSQGFQELWKRISRKSTYQIRLDSEKLIADCVERLNRELRVDRVRVVVTEGESRRNISKDSLDKRSAFELRRTASDFTDDEGLAPWEDYDLVAELDRRTDLTRRTLRRILEGIPTKMPLFKRNPEQFILNAGKIIRQEMNKMLVQRIEYHPSPDGDSYRMDTIFGNMTGTKEHVLREAKKHVYPEVQCDSKVELDFARALEKADEVDVYAKLPLDFKIPTPLGDYTPDWAIVLKEKKGWSIYFVAETKGSIESEQLREIENKKTQCARKHFEAIAQDLRFELVSSYEDLSRRFRP